MAGMAGLRNRIIHEYFGVDYKTVWKIKEENITAWRRTVCGDLSAAFREYKGEKITLPEFLEKEQWIESIYNAKFKGLPDKYKKLTEEEISSINAGEQLTIMPKQERGIRSASALPYELYVNGQLLKDKKQFEINFEAAKNIFGDRASGSPFAVYAIDASERWLPATRDYAVAAGHEEKDAWQLNKFENNIYHLKVYGPNGFYRSFKGNGNDPVLDIKCSYERSKLNSKRLTGNLLFTIVNNDTKALTVALIDNSYKTGNRSKTILPKTTTAVVMNLEKSFGWYDASIKVKGFEFFEQQFAGHVETGEVSKTDPLMGEVI